MKRCVIESTGCVPGCAMAKLKQHEAELERRPRLEQIETVFGRFNRSSLGRLEITYDYETSAIFSFRDIANLIQATEVLDIGANIGVYSIYCSSLQSVEAIWAFEPAPVAFDQLIENIRIQDKSEKIHAYKVAASDGAGSVAFRIVSEMSGANRIVTSADPGQQIFVQSERIDALISSKGKSVAVKIDVEGHELSVLSGMKNLLLQNNCYLQIECLDPEKLIEVKEFLKSMNYNYVFSLRDDHLFISDHLSQLVPEIISKLSQAVSSDLLHLLNLRRKVRQTSLSARKLRDIAGYRADPLFLSRGQSPF